ncbi:MAG TPA: dTDP-4-dehydrorhamnose 3,5-epimerase [Blastocatellia bacterium]|nr:dTDP-4-dehydrorhamnose 3,5-epimerase [Blastocatellia bacterium]
MKLIETSLPGVRLLEPSVFADERGCFFESYNQARLKALGITDRFVQDNHASSAKGTLRGLHYQIEHAQAKLCRVISGEVLDVVVDIRRGSPAFGHHESALLSAENRLQIYVPAGCAHGYLVLSDTADFVYKCSDYYYPEGERGVAWDDPAVAIAWGIEQPLLSAKDNKLPRLAAIPPEELPVFRQPPKLPPA